jgi:hypothetical protein
MHIPFDVPEPTVDAAGVTTELHIDAVKPLRQRALCRLPFASRAFGQVRGSNELLAQVAQLGPHVGDIASDVLCERPAAHSQLLAKKTDLSPGDGGWLLKHGFREQGV